MAGGEMCNWDKIEGLGVEESVRDEVIRGCELTRRLQTVLNSGQGPDMHQLMADFSAKIVATFSKALHLLNSGSAGWRGEERIGGFGVEDGRRSPTVLPSAKYRASDSPRSGARSHAGGSAPREKKFKWNNELAQRSESFKEGVHRRKNLLPKLTVRISAYNCDPGNGMLPQDGHAWRKYGQKVIFGSHYPRSYYRCTHRNSMGCQATKQVQRAQDDPSVFEVTYIGFHTCETDPRLHDIRLSPLVPQIGSQRDSTISSAFSFGSHCNPQSETCGTHGLTATRFISGSEPASSPWFGIDSGGGCEVENEDLGDFVKHSASTPFSYSFDFYNNPSHWGDPASNAMQPNTNYRPSELYASPYRDQGGEVQNSNGCTAMSEGAVGMQDFAGVFGSHEISDPTYSPLVPATPLMGSMEGVNSYGQHLQASEPELIEVVSGHTPADDSRMPNMDLIFNRLSPDSFLQFERVDPF